MNENDEIIGTARLVIEINGEEHRSLPLGFLVGLALEDISLRAELLLKAQRGEYAGTGTGEDQRIIMRGQKTLTLIGNDPNSAHPAALRLVDRP